MRDIRRRWAGGEGPQIDRYRYRDIYMDRWIDRVRDIWMSVTRQLQIITTVLQ